MKYLASQYIMVWLLPVIVVGGLFFPVLGYIVVGMMAFLLTMSFFKGRYWCWHLCPRGAFLDIVVSHMSPGRSLPSVFYKTWLRSIVLLAMMSLLVFRLVRTGGNPAAIGMVFVMICLVTTLVAVILAAVSKHRGWCVICPMGFLQEIFGKFSKRKR